MYRDLGNDDPRQDFNNQRLRTKVTEVPERMVNFHSVPHRMAYNLGMLTDEDKRWISERLEKVETAMLTEFHKWASPVELRQRSHAAALRALDAEVESLSDRLKNLERR